MSEFVVPPDNFVYKALFFGLFGCLGIMCLPNIMSFLYACYDKWMMTRWVCQLFHFASFLKDSFPQASKKSQSIDFYEIIQTRAFKNLRL
jgi:hypothetical protein